VTLPDGGRGIDQDGNGTIDSTEGVSAIGAQSLISNRDGLRQTVIDIMQLVREIQVGIDVDGDGSPDLDASRIYYAGQSFGGIYGTQLLGLEPAIRNLPPVTATPDQSAIQTLIDNAEWAQQAGTPAAYAPYISMPVIFQFARGDKTVPNPTTTATLRAGGLVSRATLFRNDLAHAANPLVPTNPHTFLTNIANPAAASFALAAQGQIATFFARTSPSSRRLLLLGPRGAERQDHDFACRLRLDDLQGGPVGCVLEQPLPRTQYHREDHQPVLVDEVVLHQRLHELRAAGDEEVATRPLFQLRDRLGDVTLDHRGVVPVCTLERSRDDELRHRVHLLGEPGLVRPRRPGRGETFVGLAPQEQRVGGENLVELELVAFRAPVELKGPAAALEAFGSARVFHHAVQRHELRYDEFAHCLPPLVVCSEDRLAWGKSSPCPRGKAFDPCFA
jgi:hypothetical protein